MLITDAWEFFCPKRPALLEAEFCPNSPVDAVVLGEALSVSSSFVDFPNNPPLVVELWPKRPPPDDAPAEVPKPTTLLVAEEVVVLEFAPPNTEVPEGCPNKLDVTPKGCPDPSLPKSDKAILEGIFPNPKDGVLLAASNLGSVLGFPELLLSDLGCSVAVSFFPRPKSSSSESAVRAVS